MSEKKLYSKPAMQKIGNIEQITHGGGGPDTDGGGKFYHGGS